MTQMKLTEVYDPRFRIEKGRTVPGMAHWAGGGPEGKTCRECDFYTFEGYWSPSSKKTANGLKDGRCRKYKEMMMGKKGVKFDYRSKACKFFELNPKPPAVRDPAKTRFAS